MPQINTLYSQFTAIQAQSAVGDRFNVISIPGMSHKLGASTEGFPKFFVRTNSSASTVQNVVREILSVEYNVPCQISDNTGNVQDDQFSIITLRSLDQPLQSCFIEIFTLMLKRHPVDPSQRELAVEVENLIAIFSALVQPPKKKIQGLWAELLVIDKSSSPETLIAAWHSAPTAKYDFTSGRDKIEVKSTSSEERVHRFALDQLNPGEHSNLLIASVIVRESGPAFDGLSVKGLYERICDRVTAINSQLKLYTIIANTIGSDIDKLDGICFDYTGASDSLAFYDYRDVPSIAKESVPEKVSEVKFTSDLSGLVDVRDEESDYNIKVSPLFKSLI